jgi:NADH-quinone oxidoreductase subunit G
VPGSAKIYRIRPRVNEAVNGPWICDYGRYGFVEAQNTGRSDRPFWNKGGAKTELSWDKARIVLGVKLKALRESGRMGRAAVAASGWLTNEELYLIRKIFRDDLKVSRLFIVDPKPGEGDALLLRPDRAPNRRGAAELGFDLATPSLEALSRETEVLILFGPHLAAHFDRDEIRAAFDKIAFKALVTSHLTGLVSLADGVLASATPAEKEGSFTNADGRVQRFAATARSCPDVRPELRILQDLALEIGLRSDLYGPAASARTVFEALAKEIPFFGARA